MKKQPITVLLLSISLLLGPGFAAAQEENETTTANRLREALFAEEADRDLAKAENGYREIIKSFDADRAYAATAILRLAEILNQRGETAEAEKWFGRVLQEFPDQQAIAKVAAARLGDKAAEFVARPSSEEEIELQKLKQLLAGSPDLLDAPTRGSTPLADAAARGDSEIVRFLLENGASLDGGPGRQAPLEAAISSGGLAVLQQLLDAGAKIEDGLLLAAIDAGNYAATELLLKKGANPNKRATVHLTNHEIDPASEFNFPYLRILPTSIRVGSQKNSKYLMAPLDVAVFKRFQKLTDLLLENGAKPGGHAESLRLAIIDEDVELVAKLLGAGADANAVWEKKATVLNIAAAVDHPAITKLLLESGADVTTKDERGLTLLFAAGTQTIPILVAAGADPDARDPEGFTPLHRSRSAAVAKALLAAGAPLEAKSTEGWTPLAWITWDILNGAERLDVAVELINAGADANAPTPRGLILGSASSAGALDLVKMLLGAGADPNAVDEYGRTALHVAVNKLDYEVVMALLKAGAKAEGDPVKAARDPNLSLPITALPFGGNVRIPSSGSTSVKSDDTPRYDPVIRALVEAGADPNSVDSKGETALVKVAQAGDEDAVDYLLANGASSATDYLKVKSDGKLREKLFLAAYLQPERRHGIIRIVSPSDGRVFDEVAAFVPAGEALPACTYSLLEAYVFSNPGENKSLGEVTIWREGEVDPLKFDLRKIIASGDPAQDVALVWGDLVQFSVPNSPEATTFSEVEKTFLDSHLKRTVKFVHAPDGTQVDSSVTQVDWILDWQQLPNSDRWMLSRESIGASLFSDSEYESELPLTALCWLAIRSDGSHIWYPEKWMIERSNGLKIEVLGGNQLPTVWFEEGDQIGYEGSKKLSPMDVINALNEAAQQPGSGNVKIRRVKLPPKSE